MAGTQRFTAEQVKAALVAHKGLLYLTAKALGCTYRTVRNYVARYPSVREALDAERGALLDTAELKLYESILKGEAWGITLCLKTLGRERGYVERQEVLTWDAHGMVEAAESAHEQLTRKLDELQHRVNGQEER